MLFNARCWTPPAAALVIATIFLSGCERVGSEGAAPTCPPLVEYSRAEQAQVANEVAELSEGAMIIDWLSDYAVMRGQARICAGLKTSTNQ